MIKFNWESWKYNLPRPPLILHEVDIENYHRKLIKHLRKPELLAYAVFIRLIRGFGA
jgi:hypothetical protein